MKKLCVIIRKERLNELFTMCFYILTKTFYTRLRNIHYFFSDKDGSYSDRCCKDLSLRTARIFFLLVNIIFLFPTPSGAHVKIRIFAGQVPSSVLFTVREGGYFMNCFSGGTYSLLTSESVLIAKHGKRIAVKKNGLSSFVCDSVLFSGVDEHAVFMLRVNTNNPVRQCYAGDLLCIPDLKTVVLVNMTDIESYIAGVVQAEGGPGKHAEYLKTQAVIARTYLYKYFNKHHTDRYNLCDNTHCQVFNGITGDTAIIASVEKTRGRVILAPDSTLIISAFHSNCGGETSPSGYVWLTDVIYLKGIKDPWCASSRNAQWGKSYSTEEWTSYLRKSGETTGLENISQMTCSQENRGYEYTAGNISLPFVKIRDDLGLRSAFFSIIVENDSVILVGRGYGHGVGLCQEGAMEMAKRGYDYREIIDFYYTGVIIADIVEAIQREEADNQYL